MSKKQQISLDGFFKSSPKKSAPALIESTVQLPPPVSEGSNMHPDEGRVTLEETKDEVLGFDIPDVPDRIYDGSVWFCRKCEETFEGPPIIINHDKQKRVLYNQYRCRSCKQVSCHQVWSKEERENDV
jgi:hypothetical protein